VRRTVVELDVFGRASAGPVFQSPVLSDPSSFAVAERRLRREADRRPESNAALLALRELYRTHGAADRFAEVDRLETERFSPATRLGWRFGGELELVGYDRRARGGRELEVTYYWKAERRMDRDYAASVRFDGPARFQIDYVLGEPARPTQTWKPGEIVKQTERVTIPVDAPPGRYVAELGVWSPSDRRHLRLAPWWHPARTAVLLSLDATPDHLVARAP
jgi:hypothetical protein